jgi:hypothetical protein
MLPFLSRVEVFARVSTMSFVIFVTASTIPITLTRSGALRMVIMVFINTNPPCSSVTNAAVQDFHHSGGSFLKLSHGGLDMEATIQFLQTYSVNQLYILGGDGANRAAYQIHEHCQALGLNIAIVGIPKTIDCDID